MLYKLKGSIGPRRTGGIAGVRSKCAIRARAEGAGVGMGTRSSSSFDCTFCAVG